jgi:transposase
LFQVHSKRGKQALDDINVLPGFRGVAVHDCYSSYYQYKQCNHGLCNAHILRELQAASELTNQAWAQNLKDFLVETHKKVEAAKTYEASALPKGTCKKIHEDYLALVVEGKNSTPFQRKLHPKGPAASVKLRPKTYSDV